MLLAVYFLKEFNHLVDGFNLLFQCVYNTLMIPQTRLFSSTVSAQSRLVKVNKIE